MVTIEQIAFLLAVGGSVGVAATVGGILYTARRDAGGDTPPLSPWRLLRLIIATCPTEVLELDRIFWRVGWGLWVCWPGTHMFETVPGVYKWMRVMPEWGWGLISMGLGMWMFFALLVLKCPKCRKTAARAIALFDITLLLGFVINGVATTAVVFYLREAIGSAWMFGRLAERVLFYVDSRDASGRDVDKGIAWRWVTNRYRRNIQKPNWRKALAVRRGLPPDGQLQQEAGDARNDNEQAR